MQYANRSNWKCVHHSLSFFDQSFCLLFFAPFEAGIYPGITRTRDFCEFCITLPVPGTSVSSVRHSYPYPILFIFVLPVGYTCVLSSLLAPPPEVGILVTI